MYQTKYHKPSTVSEAAQVFSGNEDAAYLSGGHTLLPAMKGRLAAPAHLVDLRRIPELKGVRVEGDRVVIGATTTHAEVAASQEVAGAIAPLAGLAGSIGDVHVRHVGTIGGSVANNDPAADYPSAVLALNATVHTDRRDIAADEYFQGVYSTALEPGEIVIRIGFPIPQSAGYAKFRNPASRYAMAASFVARLKDGSVRVAITGAGSSGVFRWTEAEEALARDFSAAALQGLAIDPSEIMSDMHGSSEYRAHLAAVMTRRAVENMGKVTVSP